MSVPNESVLKVRGNSVHWNHPDIKLLDNPGVYLISRQVICNDYEEFLYDEEIEAWKSDTDNVGDFLPELAGRMCYMSYDNPRPGGNKAYLGNIKKSGHGSVLEHTVFGMIFTRISRSLSHEQVRHRQGVGYSQLSQRYVDEDKLRFVIPPCYLRMPCNQELDSWIQGVRHEQTIYLNNLNKLLRTMFKVKCCDHPDVKLLGRLLRCLNCGANQKATTEEKKIVRQTARSLLPNSAETKMKVTANVRTWRFMLEQRTGEGADEEIRRLYNKVYYKLLAASPELFCDYQKIDLPDGTFSLKTEFKKL